MALIEETYIAELEADANERIVEVIGKAVELKKAGKNHTGLCAFHNEKSPSFVVNPEKGFFKCYGCGKNGSALQFVAEYYNLPFPEAVARTADIIGFRPVEYERKEETAKPTKGLARAKEALSLATKVYVTQLSQSPETIHYFKSRGITGEDVGRFSLGFAPDSFDFLPKLLIPKVGINALRDSGLVSFKEDNVNRVWDFFRNRMMFPVRNTAGQTVAFGARTLLTDPAAVKKAGKYKNSPETDLKIFVKGNHLYGLYESLQVRSPEEGTMNVVEGYMDVIASHRHGFTNTVAPMGTAVTTAQIEKLFRYSDSLRFVFDGDQAGLSAAFRAVKECLPLLRLGKEASVVIMPADSDPDSILVSENGKQTYQDLLSSAKPVSKFLIDHLTQTSSLDTAEGKARVVRECKAIADLMTDTDLRLIFLHEIRNSLNLAMRSISKDNQASFVGEIALAEPASHQFLTQLDKEASECFNDASEAVRAYCGLIFKRPEWRSMFPNVCADGLSEADADLLQFAEHTLDASIEKQVPPGNVYSTKLRYLVMLLESIPGSSLEDEIAITRAFGDLTSASIQKKNNMTQEPE